MSLVLTFSALVNALGGAVLVAFGAFVASRRPRTNLTWLFAIFCMAFGLQGILYYGVTIDDPLYFGAGAMALVGAAALATIALAFPAPLAGPERRLVVVPGLVALAWFFLALVWTTPFAVDWPVAFVVWRVPPDSHAPFYLWHAGFITLVATHLFAVLLFTLRAWRANDARMVRSLATLSGTLALYPGVVYGVLYFVAYSQGRDPVAFVTIGVLLLAAALWLMKAARGPAPRASRNAALAILAGPATGLVVTSLLGVQGSFQGGIFALVRTVVVLVLGGAMLRHQLLEMDMTVRWTLSRSTVAAVFIAVFFIASEGAQQFFGGQFGGAYVGIAAAGALVFAIAPLQRAAERLAERAVPVALPSPAPSTAPRRHDVYRDAVRYALRDGVLGRSEELHLARLAEELGIGAGTAMEIRHAVDTERAEGAR